MSKAFVYIAYTTLGAALIIVLGVFFMAFYPYKIVTVNKEPFPVLTPRVRAGEAVRYTADLCRHTSVPADVTPQLEDGLIYFLPPFTGAAKQGCHKNTIEVLIPQNIPPGRYILKLRSKYKVNPIREIWKTYTTEEFEVYK